MSLRSYSDNIVTSMQRLAAKSCWAICWMFSIFILMRYKGKQFRPRVQYPKISKLHMIRL